MKAIKPWWMAILLSMMFSVSAGAPVRDTIFDYRINNDKYVSSISIYHPPLAIDSIMSSSTVWKMLSWECSIQSGTTTVYLDSGETADLSISFNRKYNPNPSGNVVIQSYSEVIFINNQKNFTYEQLTTCKISVKFQDMGPHPTPGMQYQTRKYVFTLRPPKPTAVEKVKPVSSDIFISNSGIWNKSDKESKITIHSIDGRVIDRFTLSAGSRKAIHGASGVVVVNVDGKKSKVLNILK